MAREDRTIQTRLRIREVAEDKQIASIVDLHSRTILSGDRLSYSTLYRLWHNEPGIDPQLSTLERIAAALGVPVSELLEEPTQKAG
jgi:transcriptional regulator with XRE-family HTH domain